MDLRRIPQPWARWPVEGLEGFPFPLLGSRDEKSVNPETLRNPPHDPVRRGPEGGRAGVGGVPGRAPRHSGTTPLGGSARRGGES